MIAQKLIIRNQNALRGTRATYHLLVHAGENGFSADPNMTSIEMDRGQLWISGIPIHAPKFTADHINWRQHTTHGYNAGCIYLHDNGLSVHGTISQGDTAGAATHFDVVGTAIKPIVYNTQISKSPLPSGTDPSKIPASDFDPGLRLEIGYELQIGDTTPRPTVNLDGKDITSRTTWAVDDKGWTVLRIALDDATCFFAPNLYRTAQMRFDPYDMSVRGTGIVQAVCGTTIFPPGTEKIWTAQPELSTARFVTAKRAADVARLVAADDTLTVRELITLLPNDQVNQDANSMLVRNMKWAMGQKDDERQWLADFFGQTPPAGIPDNEIELIKKSLDWYQNKFAMAYMTQAFNIYTGPNEPTTRITGDDAKRLDYFLRSGLAASSDYTVQNQGIYFDAYTGAQPRLAAYLADAGKKGTNWAQQVFDELTGTGQFILMVNRVAGAAGDPAAMAPVNNFACLLTALDRSGKTANAYVQSVLSGVITTLVPQTSQQDKDTVMPWLPTAMEVFLRELADGNIPGQTDISQAQTLEMYQTFLEHSKDITESVGELLQSISAMSLLERTQAFEDGFETIADKFPKIAKAARFFLVIGWIGGLAGIITALVKGDWNKMTDQQKATFVTSCAQTVINAFRTVPEIFNGVKGLTLDAWNKLTARLQAPENQEATTDLQQDLVGEGEDVPYVAAETLEPALAARAAGRVASDLYARLFREGVGVGVLKILGAIVAVAMTIWTLWQLIEDIQTNASVSAIVFDAIQFAATFGTMVCLFVDLFVASTIIPVIGAVLAVIGIIVAFIASFVEKPKNPVEQWMVDHGVTFAHGLPAAPPALA